MPYYPEFDQSIPGPAQDMARFNREFPGMKVYNWDTNKNYDQNVALLTGLGSIKTPTLNLGAVPQTLAPTTAPTFDPLLSPASILKQAQGAQAAAAAPLDVNKFVAPQIPLLQQGIQDQENVDRASAQSNFAARGMTGSSTEVQTLTRDIPANAQKALAEGTVKLLTAAYPLAQAEKAQAIDAAYKGATLSTQLRAVLGDETFKKLSLDQQRELANQDVQVKLALADVEMKFQASMKQAEMRFQAAQNDLDRQAAQQQFDYLKSERSKARTQAFIKSLTTLAGVGIAVATGPAGMAGKDLMYRAAVGAYAGGQADAFGGFFTME